MKRDLLFGGIIVLLVLFGVLLSSCAPKVGTTKLETQTVYVDRPVPCVQAKDVPAKPAPPGKRPAELSAALDIATAKLVELFGPALDGKAGYVAKADALLNGPCKEVKMSNGG